MKILFHYYKSLHSFNIPFSILVGFFGTIANGGTDGFLRTFIISFLSGGFLLSVFFYGLRHENLYYFYYNKGYSKWKLIGCSYGINVAVASGYWLIKNSLA